MTTCAPPPAYFAGEQRAWLVSHRGGGWGDGRGYGSDGNGVGSGRPHSFITGDSYGDGMDCGDGNGKGYGDGMGHDMWPWEY